MLSKLGIVEEESDETIHWLELLHEAGFIPCETLAPLVNEAREFLAITIAARKSIRSKLGVREEIAPYLGDGPDA